ncbi:MAG: SRPBCC domain-containing protein [Cyclobacteriaceae bacterium]
MDYSKQITYSTSAESLFTAITQNLDQWWGKTDTSVEKKGDEFKVSFGHAFWKFRVSEFTPNEKLTWECVDGQPEFEHEWVGTKVHWNISGDVEKTQLSFTHEGLTPSFECYDVCAPTWDMFLTTSLRSFVEKGKGMSHS